MPSIQFSGNVTVAGSPTLPLDHLIDAKDCDTVCLVDLVLKAGAANQEVNLQPGDEMKLLAVISDWFGENLSYSPVNPASSPIFILNAPHIFVGGAVAGLGDTKQQKLYFSNGTTGANAKDAKIKILIGRKATT